MTAIHPHTTDTTADASVDQPTPLARRVLAALRIAFGLTFLWAFLDKTFALGFHTGYDQTGQLDRFGDAAWINGGSPTEGFLAFGADGPFKGFYNSIAGAPVVGRAVHARPARHRPRAHLRFRDAPRVVAGVTMYVLMWTVVMPPENHPFLDEHVLGALTIAVLGLYHAGDTWGLGTGWPSCRWSSATPSSGSHTVPTERPPAPGERAAFRCVRMPAREASVQVRGTVHTSRVPRGSLAVSSRVPGARWPGGERCAARSRPPAAESPTPSSATVSRSS